VADGRELEGGWAIVGNARCYGGPYHATPGADPFATGLELVLQQSVGRRAAVPFALGIPWQRHVRRRDVVRGRFDRIRLEPSVPGGRVPYQVDGDLVGQLPVEVRATEDELLVRLPTASPGP
jgi:diacylglycerol kinase family enzyme